MKVEHWLRNSLVIKMRNRLSTWMREDFIAFAEAEFGTIELTKIQVSQLVEKLKHPQVTKPPKQLSDKYKATASYNGVPVELVFKDNQGVTNWPNTYWYLTEGRAEIRFSSPRECANWAFSLIRNYPKDNWSGLVYRWKEMTKLRNFRPEELQLEHLPVSNDLVKNLNMLTKQSYKLTVPLPDNASLEKQYWGLSEGDRLVNPDGEQLIVKQVRSNLDGPPTVSFERISHE